MLEEVPGELLDRALQRQVSPEIRPPRIVRTAWVRIGEGRDGPGLGEERLAELEAAVQTDPRRTRTELERELDRASRRELPVVLALYGTALRLESDLLRAELVLRQAIEMARALDLPAAEADLLIRLSLVALERHGPSVALRCAEEATLLFARHDDREGEGRGFLTTGTFRYYNEDYRGAARDLEAALKRLETPWLLFSAHQVAGFCWLALDAIEQAAREASRARQLAPQVPSWLVAKLDWLEARLSEGAVRLGHLRTAQTGLAGNRPADCLLVTVELIEELLACGRVDEAGREVPRVCDLVERAGESRQVQQVVSHLITYRTRLTPKLVARLRRALDRARDRTLVRLGCSEIGGRKKTREPRSGFPQPNRGTHC